MWAKRTIAITAISLMGVGAATFALNQWSSTASPTLEGLPIDRWSAVAPALVEPSGGSIRVGAAISGRIRNLYVQPGRRVTEGQLLAEFDNSEQLARLKAVAADVAFRRSERDHAILPPEGGRMRAAEDAAFDAQLEEDARRDALDQLYRELSGHDPNPFVVNEARKALAVAAAERQSAERAIGELLRVKDALQPTRTESALAIARAEHAVARAILEKTLIRAPSAGSIIELQKRVGETADNSPSDSVLVLGDLSHMRLRAELNERMIARVRIGQDVVVRSDAFEREFAGRVASIASSVHPKGLANRAPGAAPTERVVDVFIALDDGLPFITGMTVDAYFNSLERPRENAQRTK